VICPLCKGSDNRPVERGVRVCISQRVVGMTSYRPYGPPVIPVFSPCGHKFTPAQSQAAERAEVEARARAAAESEQRRERERAAAERRAAEAPRLEAIRRQAEAVEKERLARVEVSERRTWLALWLCVALISAGATAVLCFGGSGSLPLIGAAALPWAFALFRLLIVGFDPPVKPREGLSETLGWSVTGLIAGFLFHVSAGVGS
jgi:hypothetical protein